MIQYDAHMVIGIIKEMLLHTEYVCNVDAGVFEAWQIVLVYVNFNVHPMEK